MTVELGPLADVPSVGPDDAELVREFLATRSGDTFGALVDRYKDRVFRLAISILGPGLEAEADEVAQEVFVRIFRELARFRMESRFSTWLYRITYNRAIDCRRSTRHSRPHVDDRVLASLADAGDRSDPHAAAAERQRSAAVRRAVDGLPDVYRSALYLYYWMERSIGDIAELLNVPEGTVKSYLHRGRHAVEAELRREGFTHV